MLVFIIVSFRSILSIECNKSKKTIDNDKLKERFPIADLKENVEILATFETHGILLLDSISDIRLKEQSISTSRKYDFFRTLIRGYDETCCFCLAEM